LQKDFNKRLTTKDALNHPWINRFCLKNIESNLVNRDTIKLFLEFARKTALQKEIYYFIAKVSNENEIADIKDFFNQFDTNNMGNLNFEEIKEGFKRNGLNIKDNILQEIFNGLDFHKMGKINYSEFLAAMVSSNNFDKEEKLTSVFNLLRENEQNKNYINFESLLSAVKALNLNINEEEIKTCFKEYDNEIDFEHFKKLIISDEIDKKSYNEELLQSSNKNNNNINREKSKHKSH